VRFKKQSCAGCALVAACDEAENVGAGEISRGHSCSSWKEATAPTIAARKDAIETLGMIGLKAILDVPTTKIHSGDMMSDKETRTTELGDLSRPQLKTELYNILAELKGKDLQAALKVYNPETKWNSDDVLALKEAKRAGIRTKPDRLIEVILGLEFPEKPKTTRRRKAAEKEPEETEEAPKKTTRRRRTTKKEEPKADPIEVSFDAEAFMDALIEKIGPSLNGIADAVEALQKDVSALKTGQTVLGVATVDEEIESHDDLKAFLEEG